MPTDDPFTEDFLRLVEAGNLDDATIRQLADFSAERREELASALNARAKEPLSIN